jgi:hypothetical protein
MHPLVGTRRCLAHTEGLAKEYGRRGGLNRRRPSAPKRTLSAPASSEAAETSTMMSLADVDLMSAEQVRRYLQLCVTRAVAGQLDPDLAKIAVSATTPWLRAIELDERVADIERRLAKLERHDTTDEAHS